MHDPTKLEARQVATAAMALHGQQGEKLRHQAVTQVWRNPMGLAVRTPGLPEHWGIRPAGKYKGSGSTKQYQ
jgi:serine/threonine protein kinase HipA of HipAB toxin-antitoxin module